MNTYQINHQQAAEKRMRLRYVQEALDPFVIPRVRTTLGREETTLGVSTCCWVYVYEYGSSGRRSEADGTRYDKKKLEKKTRTTVRLQSHCCSMQHARPGVPYNVQHRVETAVRVT